METNNKSAKNVIVSIVQVVIAFAVMVVVHVLALTVISILKRIPILGAIMHDSIFFTKPLSEPWYYFIIAEIIIIVCAAKILDEKLSYKQTGIVMILYGLFMCYVGIADFLLGDGIAAIITFGICAAISFFVAVSLLQTPSAEPEKIISED